MATAKTTMTANTTMTVKTTTTAKTNKQSAAAWISLLCAVLLATPMLAQFKTYTTAPPKVTAPSQQQPELPFKAPPGQTIKITSSYSSYNFSKLVREIPLPMQAFIWQPSEVKKGYKVDTVLHKASKPLTELHKNLATLFPEIGAPSRVIVQGMKGKQGPGTILYVEYPVDMPVDARWRINRKLYGTDSTPAKITEEQDQHLVSKNMFIIWSFKDRKSLAKEAHQKKSFELVSLYATEWDKAMKAAAAQSGQPANNQTGK